MKYLNPNPNKRKDEVVLLFLCRLFVICLRP